MDKRIRYFLAVAEERNFNRAAERLRIAQSALSRQIQALEYDLGFPLFDRGKRAARLTSAGEVFHRRSVGLSNDYADAVAQAQQTASGMRGQIEIGANEVSIRNAALIALLRRFRERAPHLGARFRIEHSRAQIGLIYRSEIDIGFLFDAPDDTPELGRMKLGSETYELLLPIGHRLADKTRITIEDLRGERFIVFARGGFNRYHWDAALHRMMRAGVTPIVQQEIDNETALISVIAAGCAIGFVHGSNRHRRLEGVVVRPVEDISIVFSFDAVWRKDNESPALAAMKSVLAELAH